MTIYSSIVFSFCTNSTARCSRTKAFKSCSTSPSCWRTVASYSPAMSMEQFQKASFKEERIIECYGRHTSVTAAGRPHRSGQAVGPRRSALPGDQNHGCQLYCRLRTFASLRIVCRAWVGGRHWACLCGSPPNVYRQDIASEDAPFIWVSPPRGVLELILEGEAAKVALCGNGPLHDQSSRRTGRILISLTCPMEFSGDDIVTFVTVQSGRKADSAACVWHMLVHAQRRPALVLQQFQVSVRSVRRAWSAAHTTRARANWSLKAGASQRARVTEFQCARI